jgi:DNA-binding CsgD family transcriptional regulator/tetratricopeptide (TPR) repeat protein
MAIRMLSGGAQRRLGEADDPVVVARPGLCPVMVGRGAELRELERLLAGLRAPGGAPAVAIVSGEAGVGKSRLLREFCLGVDGATLLLAGHADEGDFGVPFALLREAVAPIVSAWTDVPAPLAHREHGLRHLLDPLLTQPGHPEDHDHAAEELLHAGMDLLRYLVGAGPGVLLFEDLHWADAESIELFGRLAEDDGLPLLLVGTFRPEDFDRRHPLGELLANLERQRSVTHVSLARLSRLDVSEMLEATYGRPVSQAVTSALHRRTQGNPFFVEELIATAGGGTGQQGEVDPDGLADARLPWNAAEAVLRRVDELPRDVRRVLDAASVLPATIPFDVLAAVAELGEDDLIDVLRLLVERGLLHETEPDAFAFRHALTREAVAGQLLGRQRRRLHEAALDALLATGSDDHAALAVHAAGAGDWDALVVHSRLGAKRFMAEGSSAQALRLAELGLAESADDMGLRALASRAAWAVGLATVALRHAEQWRQLAEEQQDPAQQAAALRQIATAAWEQGDRETTERMVEAALAVSEPLGDSAERAWCLAARSQIHMLVRENAAAVQWADRALELADRLGLSAVRASALVNKGTALCDTPGRERDGAALLAQAREEATAAGEVVTLIRALTNAMWYFVERADPRAARPLIAEAKRVAERHGLDVAGLKASFSAAHLALIDGDRGTVLAEVAAGRRHGRSMDTTDLELLEIELLMEHGDLEVARERLRVVASGPDPLDPGSRLWLPVLDARVAAAAGDGPRVQALLDAYRGKVDRESVSIERSGATIEATAILILACIQAGLPPEPLAALFDGVVPADDPQRETRRGWVGHVEGALAEARGEHQFAAAAYQRALNSVRPARTAAMVAETEMGLARCFAENGDLDAARVAADAAVARLERWPGWRRDAAETLRRRLGGKGGGRGQQRDPDALLTPREREVLVLLTEGLTNRQVAEALYVSVKTAATHVSNILAKVGASTRAEAAAWAVREGIKS